MDIRYLLGLIEGEGCFGNYIVNNKKLRKSGIKIYKIRCIRFVILMHTRDFPLMKEIRNFLGMGSANLFKSCAVYSISNRPDLRKLIKIIDDNGAFMGYKNKQYSKWRKTIFSKDLNSL